MQIKHRLTGEVIFEQECETFKEADLREADLSEADLRWANLRRADLREADLSEANLRGADLRWADLREADLREADLRGADLREADLSEANLRGADLRWADLREADLIVIHMEFYTAYVQKTHTRIRCEYHSNDDWKQYSDAEIDDMDSNALVFWNKYKTMIFAAMDSLNS